MTIRLKATPFVALLALSSVALVSSQETCTTVIHLDSGPVCTSRRLTNDDGVEFVSFRGVPYAKQPLGELRFQELQPVEPWNTILDASENGPVCPQSDYFYETLFGPKNYSESCIHANIHVPLYAIPPANHIEPQNLPILVYIHGGSFAYGSGDDDVYGPENLMSKDVIVVTFNYRLNVFGFLSLNSTYIPGNNGIRDTITLLRWVKRNARSFGGDPDNITLGGQSAGAMMTHYLSVSPAIQGAGLFHRAIAMSGSAVRGYFTTVAGYSKAKAEEFLAALNITSTDPAEVHQILVDLPLETIMDVHANLLNTNGLLVFTPVVESPLEGVTQILDDLPENLILQGRNKDTPFLFGYTTFEGETFRDRLNFLNFTAVFDASSLPLTPLQITYTKSINVTTQVASLLEQRYFNGSVTYEKIMEWLGDFGFVYPALRSATTVADEGTAYIYEFNYIPTYNLLRVMKNYTDAAHVEDMTYLFRPHTSLLDETLYSELDRQMMNWMTTIVTNFMKCSNPTCEVLSERSWPPVNSNGLVVQYIDRPGVYQIRSLSEKFSSLLEIGDTVYSL